MDSVLDGGAAQPACQCARAGASGLGGSLRVALLSLLAMLFAWPTATRAVNLAAEMYQRQPQ